MSIHEQRRQWLELGSAAASDALRDCGKFFQAMDGGIRPLSPEMRVCGPAFTVRCYPGATWALERAIDLASPGDVLVVDGGGSADVILMGGLMSAKAQSRGLAGVVLDAAVRDIEDIISLDFPVFSRHICPRAGTFAEIGEWQTIVCCGRIPVRPGDFVVADRSGIVIVPRELSEKVFQQAGAIRVRERAIEESLRGGAALAGAGSGNGDDTGGSK